MADEAKPTENAPKPSKRVDLEVLTALDTARTQLYHFKAIVITGMGFFTDAYDLFCISAVTNLLGRIYYYDQKHRPDKVGVLPPGPYFAVTGVALFGTLAGQLFFGKLGDMLGRKKVYGFTLVLMIVSSIGSALTFGRGAKAVMLTLCFFRFWLGFGIGGDYPLSATIMSEYANTRTRGGFIAAVFAMQGFGILVAGLVATIVSEFFILGFVRGVPGDPHKYEVAIPSFEEDPHKSTPAAADYIWRIVFAFGAIPAALTFYWRMKMPETARYTALVEGNTRQAAADMATVLEVEFEAEDNKADGKQVEQFGLWSREFTRRHGLHLLGTTMCWFLLDIAFYSQTLFQKDVLTSVGWLDKDSKMNAISEVRSIATAQVKLAAMSTVPGYWFTVFFIDKIGRFAIQLQGFFFMTVFMAAAAFPYDSLKNHTCKHDLTKTCGNVPVFVALYAMTFFFANFGPNSTTFVVPAEIFPARLRSTCHGLSAGAGKVGAIIGSFGFFALAQDPKNPDPGYRRGYGTRKALIGLAAVNFLGLLFTFLVPETNQRTLEDLSRENEEVGADVPHSKELSEISTVFHRKKLEPVEESS